MRHVSAVAKRTGFGGSQCNALCARGEISDVEIVELPRDEGTERRVALLARVKLAGATLSVACTHLQHSGGGAREQLAAVIETLISRPSPRLLLGDFNLGSDDVEPLLAARGFTAAPSGPTFPAGAPRRRIDWIAVDGGLACRRRPAARPRGRGPLPAQRRSGRGPAGLNRPIVSACRTRLAPCTTPTPTSWRSRTGSIPTSTPRRGNGSRTSGAWATNPGGRRSRRSAPVTPTLGTAPRTNRN